MEANTIYEGAPASAKDIESGPGAGEIKYKKGDGWGNMNLNWWCFQTGDDGFDMIWTSFVVLIPDGSYTSTSIVELNVLLLYQWHIKKRLQM